MSDEIEIAECEEELHPGGAPQHRYRITFSTHKALAYISVLDLGKIWERSLRRAGVPLKYSQGFNPRPKLQFAAPLPTGCGGQAELLDMWLEQAWMPEQIVAALSDKTPADLNVNAVKIVPAAEPPLSEQLTAADYQVWLRDIDPHHVTNAVSAFLATETVERPRRGKHHGDIYNLRPLVDTLAVTAAPAPWNAALAMRLSARPGATGRPDEVLHALELSDAPRRCIRLQLHLQEN